MYATMKARGTSRKLVRPQPVVETGFVGAIVMVTRKAFRRERLFALEK